MNMLDFKKFCSDLNSWKLAISHSRKKWKLISNEWVVMSENVSVQIPMEGIKEDGWYLVGNGYLNFTHDSVILSNSALTFDEGILKKLNVYVMYGDVNIFGQSLL